MCASLENPLNNFSSNFLFSFSLSQHISLVFAYLSQWNAAEARAEIVGPAVKYLTPGSTVKLICKVLQSTEATAYIFWYHDNRMINYDLDRGINVSSAAGKQAPVRVVRLSKAARAVTRARESGCVSGK